MQRGPPVEFVEDTHDGAYRLATTWTAEEASGLWHDLAGRWLGAGGPERHATPGEAGVVPACRIVPWAENFAVQDGYCRLE
jgi:hypothetical protein